MSNYSELLKDPRWQKKRLRVLDRDQWMCQRCGADQYTLHVHHIEYKKGIKPWDYDDSDLLTLCEYCHKINHNKTLTQLERFLLSSLFNVDFGNMNTKHISEMVDVYTEDRK
jgi:5-methylcytosine-specific restriction endonuclease McrA